MQLVVFSYIIARSNAGVWWPDVLPCATFISSWLDEQTMWRTALQVDTTADACLPARVDKCPRHHTSVRETVPVPISSLHNTCT